MTPENIAGESAGSTNQTKVTVLSYDQSTGYITKIWQELSDLGAVDLDLTMVRDCFF